MKTLLTTTLALAFALFLTNPSTALADRFVYLAQEGIGYSDYLDFNASEELQIMKAKHYHYSGSEERIFLTDTTTGVETAIFRLSSWTPEDTILIPGPGRLRVSAHHSNSYYKLWIKIKSNNDDPNIVSNNSKYATVIPENSKTDVNVILEQSTDLVNWSTVSPGQFSSSASKRFFRVRSANVPVSITGATNASPIVITSTGHLLNTGDTISISGVVGNTAANGIFTITKVDANSFSLNGSTGNGAYSSGGTWLPNP